MNVPNNELLASFRSSGPCECCGRQCSMRAAHHIFPRGSGRVDWGPNLIALGWDYPGCICHVGHHYSGKPTKAEFLAITSKREGWTVQFIESVIMAVRACPWQATFEQAENWLLSHFADKVVAEAAIAIVKRNYE